MKSNFKILVCAIAGLVLFSWLVSCRFGFGSGDNKWESSPKQTEEPKDNNQNAQVESNSAEDKSKKNTSPTPLSSQDRFTQAKKKQQRLFNDTKELKENIYDDAEKKGKLIFCTVKSLGGLYREFLTDEDAERLKDTLKNVFSLHQSFFRVLQTKDEGNIKVYLSVEGEKFSEIEYVGIKQKKKIPRQEDEEIKIYSLSAMRHLGLFSYIVTVEKYYDDMDYVPISSIPSPLIKTPSKSKDIMIPKRDHPTSTKALPYVRSKKVPNSDSLSKRKVSDLNIDEHFCDKNNISPTSEGKDTASRFFADDIVRALKKLKQYNDLPKTFSRCETKLSVVATKLANITSGKIEMEDEILSLCEKELDDVEQSLSSIKEQTSVKITVEEVDLKQILSLFNSNKGVKQNNKQPKGIGEKQ